MAPPVPAPLESRLLVARIQTAVSTQKHVGPAVGFPRSVDRLFKKEFPESVQLVHHPLPHWLQTRGNHPLFSLRGCQGVVVNEIVMATNEINTRPRSR